MKYRQQIQASLSRLQSCMETADYRGFDPYDALLSPLVKFPPFSISKSARFFLQQGVKRLPLNLRPVLAIPKSLNPVTLGLAIQAYAQDPEKNTATEKKILRLIERLTELIPSGYTGACWGYPFPWEARYARIDAYQPTVVATGIVANGLYTAWKHYGIEQAGDLVQQAAHFTLTHLHQHPGKNGSLCFSYSPFDQEKVFNASMKGVRLLAQAHSIRQNTAYADTAQRACRYVMQEQQDDGSWYYSERSTGGWVDNYHTGYILDCLDEYQRCTADHTWQPSLAKGTDYYFRHFITPEGQPRFYHDRAWPADCTAAGQTLLTAVRFGQMEPAERVALWMIENMQAQEGYFYFRKSKYCTEKTNFMRWSNAWMLAGLTALLSADHAS